MWKLTVVDEAQLHGVRLVDRVLTDVLCDRGGGGGSVVKIEDMIIQSCLQYPSCHA